jgi:methylated-DNA-[protein]-cysteine S-methyltransferase
MLTIVHFDCTPSPLGGMVLASNGDALTGAWFAGQRHQPPIGPGWERRPGLPVLRRAAVQLAAYFAGELIAFDVPLAPVGTPFQRDHRIVGADGTLTGYAGGLARKRALLALERVALERVAGAATPTPRAAPVDALADAFI